MSERTYPPREFDSETVMKFGKYVNKTCREIYEEGEDGIGYLNWMVNSFTKDTFTERFRSMIRGEKIEDVPDVDDFDYGIPF